MATLTNNPAKIRPSWVPRINWQLTSSPGTDFMKSRFDYTEVCGGERRRLDVTVPNSGKLEIYLSNLPGAWFRRRRWRSCRGNSSLSASGSLPWTRQIPNAVPRSARDASGTRATRLTAISDIDTIREATYDPKTIEEFLTVEKLISKVFIRIFFLTILIVHVVVLVWISNWWLFEK